MSPAEDRNAEREHRERSSMETELESLYLVSQVLSRSLDFRETLQEVLRTLNDLNNMRHAMIALKDESSGELLVTALHANPAPVDPVRYKPGEGIIGAVIHSGDSLVIERLADASLTGWEYTTPVCRLSAHRSQSATRLQGCWRRSRPAAPVSAADRHGFSKW